MVVLSSFLFPLFQTGCKFAGITGTGIFHVFMPTCCSFVRRQAFSQMKVQGDSRRIQKQQHSDKHITPPHKLLFDAFGDGFPIACPLCLAWSGLLSLFERLFGLLDRFAGFTLGIAGALRAALGRGSYLCALPFGPVGVPTEEVHLVLFEVGSDPGIERARSDRLSSYL